MNYGASAYRLGMVKLGFAPVGGAVGGALYGTGSPTPTNKKSIKQHAWEGAKGGAVSGFIPIPGSGAVGGYLHARKKDTGQDYFESRGDFERRKKKGK